MAYQTKYQTNFLGDFWTSYTQRRRTGGRPLTRREVGGLLDPLYASEAQKAIAAGEREQRLALANRQLNMQEEAMNRQQRAATISGLAQLPLTYGVAKQTGLISPGFELLKPSTWGGGGAAGAANAGIATQAATAPVAGMPSGVGSSLALTQEMAGVSSTFPAAPAVSGLLGPALLGGGVGLGLSKALHANKEWTGAITGAAAGTAIAPGIGTVIGGLIGFIGGLF